MASRGKLKVAAVAAVAALGLTACVGGGGGDTQQPVSQASGDAITGSLDVRVYGDWPFVKRNAESFMKDHPGVQIKVGGIDNDELRQSGGRIFTSDDAPDVVSFTYNHPIIEEWVKAGALQNVDDMWTDDLQKVLPDTVKTQSLASDGHHYAVPLGLTILPHVFYNTKAWSDAGLKTPSNRSFGSMADFQADLKTLQDKGYSQPLSSPGQSLTELIFFASLSSSCGPDTYQKMVNNWKNESAPKYTDECAVKAIDSIKSLGPYLPKGWAQETYDQSQGLFAKDSAAWVAGSWAPPVYDPGFKWDWAAMPAVEGGQATTTPAGIGVDSFLIPAKAKNAAVAKAFISYMTSPQVLEQKMGRVPARTDVDLAKVIGDNDVEISIAEDVTKFQQVPYYGISVPASVLDAMVQNVADGAVSGRLSSQQAAEALQKSADDYRAQNS